jgi:hypothetical protein
MTKTLLAIVLALVSLSNAVADTSDPMAAINEYIANFNKGDMKGMAAVCANPASILANAATFVAGRVCL